MARAPFAAMRASSASGFSIEVEFDVVEEALRSVGQARAPRVAWPLLMCAFVAVLAGGAALTESPLGQVPTVRPYTDAARGGASDVWHAIAGLAR
jgi:hypothetical protein